MSMAAVPTIPHWDSVGTGLDTWMDDGRITHLHGIRERSYGLWSYVRSDRTRSRSRETQSTERNG
jgi:hypothetical protein